MTTKLTGQGGPGRGQGRKPTGRKKVVYYITEKEAGKMSSLLHHIRDGTAQEPKGGGTNDSRI